jgi:Zn-dependent peptidase ImmA (M78 family)
LALFQPTRKMVDAASLSPAERLLWGYGIAHPSHIDLEGIANDNGARVVYRPLDGCEARLVGKDDRAVISVNSSGKNDRRRRFSLAHELSHWLWDRAHGVLQCGSESISPQNAQAKSVEAEANRSASQLILPDYLVAPWAHGKDPSLNTAYALGEEFNVTMTAAVLKLLKLTSHVAVVTCHNQHRLLWFRKSRIFPFECSVANELHHETDAFGMAFGAGGGLSKAKEEPARRWIYGGDLHWRTVRSQSLKLPDGNVLSVVYLRE